MVSHLICMKIHSHDEKKKKDVQESRSPDQSHRVADGDLKSMGTLRLGLIFCQDVNSPEHTSI